MAKDIVQDAFIAILGSKTPVENVEAYLTGCIKNAAFNRLDRERRQRAMIADFIHNTPPNLDWLHVIVNRLKCCTSKQIIKQRYFHQRSQKNIALEYQVSRNYVATKEKQALKILKKYMVEN